MRKVKLTENQFNKFLSNSQNIDVLKSEISKIEKNIHDLASVIFEMNGISLEYYQKFKLDFENKLLIINDLNCDQKSKP